MKNLLFYFCFFISTITSVHAGLYEYLKVLDTSNLTIEVKPTKFDGFVVVAVSTYTLEGEKIEKEIYNWPLSDDSNPRSQAVGLSSIHSGGHVCVQFRSIRYPAGIALNYGHMDLSIKLFDTQANRVLKETSVHLFKQVNQDIQSGLKCFEIRKSGEEPE